jgi:hypothetical protein
MKHCACTRNQCRFLNNQHMLNLLLAAVKKRSFPKRAPCVAWLVLQNSLFKENYLSSMILALWYVLYIYIY